MGDPAGRLKVLRARLERAPIVGLVEAFDALLLEARGLDPIADAAPLDEVMEALRALEVYVEAVADTDVDVVVLHALSAGDAGPAAFWSSALWAELVELDEKREVEVIEVAPAEQ